MTNENRGKELANYMHQNIQQFSMYDLFTSQL